MGRPDLDKMSNLSPFELKDTLIALASRHSERLMLNAGRGNPNFLATAPRHGFFQLGLLAMSEAERSLGDLREGVGGLPNPEGITARFEIFARARRESPGMAFLSSALSYVCEELGFSSSAFLHELVDGVLGCRYPSPVRMLRHTEEIVRHYLRNETCGGRTRAGDIDLFAVEGATAGIAYVFNSLRQNKLIAPGDTIAIGVPIFAPYIEIPQLQRLSLGRDGCRGRTRGGLAISRTRARQAPRPQSEGIFAGKPRQPLVRQNRLDRSRQDFRDRRRMPERSDHFDR
jgi:aspartate 4-decarboxylase